jgi:hypothetical protein
MDPSRRKEKDMPKYQIFYARRPTFHASGEFGTPRITVASLQVSHVHLCDVVADSLDDAWRQMQAEYWSPNGEARPRIERLGLSHTSMSVGDVIRDEGGSCWECLDLGWRAIEADPQEDGDRGQA